MELGSSRNIFNQKEDFVLVANYEEYIQKISTKTGFIKSTLEKVDRLLSILELINNHEKLEKC